MEPVCSSRGMVHLEGSHLHALFKANQKLKHVSEGIVQMSLKAGRHGWWATSLGSLFQCFNTLTVKKCFLIPSLNTPLPTVLCGFVPILSCHQFPGAWPGTLFCFPSSGSCREQWGCLSASFKVLLSRTLICFLCCGAQKCICPSLCYFFILLNYIFLSFLIIAGWR